MTTMRIIDYDPTRMIDLPGIGPCPRPVDIDQSVTGFDTLKSLRIYDFSAGQVIEGESEGDEVYVVPFGGAVEMNISGAHPLSLALSEDATRGLYMTPDHGYRLTPSTAQVQVAYARAGAAGKVACHGVTGTRGDKAETLRFTLVDLNDGDKLAYQSDGERLIHIFSGAATVKGADVRARQTVALAKGETAHLQSKGSSRLLVIWV